LNSLPLGAPRYDSIMDERHRIFQCSDRRLSLWVAAAMVLLLMNPPAGAREPRAAKRTPGIVKAPSTIPFVPDSFFENMFGGSKEELDDGLAKVEISLSEERHLGESMVGAYLAHLQRQKLKVTNRGHDVEYLRDLVATLRPFLKNKSRYPKITIYVIDSPHTDARSFPGGTLFFFRGLLEFAGSEAALLGIVGHELSHLERGHQLIALKRAKLFEQSINDGPSGNSPERMMSAMSTMAMGFARPFRPEDESEADRDGAAWSYQAGYDPREMAALFQRLHRRDGDRSAIALSFLQTHPFHIDRFRAIHQQYNALRRAAPAERLYVGRRNLKERTARAKGEFDEE